MVRACSHGKHEILRPESSMWKVNCTHFHSAVLACHFLRLSDLPYSLLQCESSHLFESVFLDGHSGVLTNTVGLCNGAECCNSSTRADCSPTWSRPVGSTADKNWHTPTHWHTHNDVLTAHRTNEKPCLVLSIAGARWDRNNVHSSHNSVTGSVHLSVGVTVASRLLYAARWVNLRTVCAAGEYASGPQRTHTRTHTHTHTHTQTLTS